MDRQSVTLLPFNRVNYILSVAGAISAGDCNCLRFFFFLHLYRLKVHEISMIIDLSPLIYLNCRSLKF